MEIIHHHLLTFSSVGFTTVYPLFASYQSYTQYSAIAAKEGATTVHLGGVAIPVGTMLRRATQDPKSTLEEDTLNFHLLNLQMWFIYWLVTACIVVVEDFSFVKMIPFYLLWRLMLSAWLIFPITNFTSLRTSSKILTYVEMQKEWETFSNEGCGLVYFKYMAPFCERQLASFKHYWNTFLNQISPRSGSTLSQAVSSVSQSLASPEETPKLADGYLHGISDIVGIMFPGGIVEKDTVLESLSSSTLIMDKVFSEYDLVDKPEEKGGLLVKQRGSAESKQEQVDSKTSSSSRFRIW